MALLDPREPGISTAGKDVSVIARKGKKNTKNREGNMKIPELFGMCALQQHGPLPLGEEHRHWTSLFRV